MPHINGEDSHKRKSTSVAVVSRPHKRTKLLLDEENSGSEGSQAGGVALSEDEYPSAEKGFRVNEEFARRFEHNKKREELHRLEEKYGKDRALLHEVANRGVSEQDAATSSSSDSEDEDDEGVLASKSLDAQIDATLKAIRAKDPRVYDEKTTFYTDMDDEGQASAGSTTTSQKPMYLSDYHRRNLLQEGDGVEETEKQPATYSQQQDELRSTIVQEMHAAGGDALETQEASQEGNHAGDSGDDFLIRKPSRSTRPQGIGTQRRVELSVEIADKDPDTYLSNFMTARAWVPSAGSQFQPFESDDEEDDQRAEAFEEAYNMRFEDPEGANEKLMSHARDAAARYSVRKEPANSRKKSRDAERRKRELEKQVREEEKARLRKLQIAEAEDKVRKIKQAAGLRATTLKQEDWSTLLDEGWDDTRWEEEMKKRFGDEYYADHESEVDTENSNQGIWKLKKPRWEDDINITDLVPDFDEDQAKKPEFDLSDDDTGELAASSLDKETNITNGDPASRSASSKRKKADAKREREEQKKAARKERRVIEKVVDDKLNAEDTIAGVGSKKTGHFRYRETSPSAFGLTPRDILMASDSQLNQYAGLKKMAAFRDSDKKRKDKKRLGKKARLREWRKETFGSEHGPQKSLADVLANNQDATERATPKYNSDQPNDIREGKKKRKRSKKESAVNVNPKA